MGLTANRLTAYAVEHKAELRRALGWRDREGEPQVVLRSWRRNPSVWLVDGNCERWLGASLEEAALKLEALVAEVPDIHTQLGAPGSNDRAGSTAPGGSA